MKSKICISILIVMIMFSSLTITNFKSMAATTANIVVDTKNVVQGNDVEVNISLQDSVDFSAANFILTYDVSVLEYKGYTVESTLKKTDGSTNGTLLLNENTSGEIKIGYMSDASQASETKYAGELLSLTFNVKSGAGTSTNIELESTTLKKDDGTDVTANITNGELRVISGIQMNAASLNLEVGNTSTLSVSTLPTSLDISNETITWESANTSIATVSPTGVVTAVAAGTTKITATVLGLSAECSVTVEEVTIPLESISLNKTEVTLNMGETETLQVAYNPTNTTYNKEVTWVSSDETIATVSENGMITAVAPGTAVITAIVVNETATCTVTVASDEEEFSISLDKTSLTLPSQQVRQLTVIYNPAGTDGEVTWYSSADTVAAVDQNGLVTALKVGTATITATVGDKTATCIVTVSGQLGDVDTDNDITAYDAYKALEASVDISLEIDVDEQIILKSDVDKDEEVTAQDAYNILEYSIGLIDEF